MNLDAEMLFFKIICKFWVCEERDSMFYERYWSSRNEDPQRVVLIIKQAISIRVVVFTENANPAKSLKPKPNKTSQQPPPTQKETKNKSHKQHPPFSGSANETNLGLFF